MSNIHLSGSGRIFKSDFLERFSRCHGMIPLIIYAPVILYHMLTLAVPTWSDRLGAAGWCVFGVVFWTFFEYQMHRFVFHFQAYPRLHYILHGIHHEYPNDASRLVMPPAASLVVAVIMWFGLQAVLESAVVKPVYAGFCAGYLWYDMTHWWIHLATPRSVWGKRIRRHHMLHHFKTPHRRYGVTTPFWDIVFGTYHSPSPVTGSRSSLASEPTEGRRVDEAPPT